MKNANKTVTMFYQNEMSLNRWVIISVGVKSINLFLCSWSVASGGKSAVFMFFECKLNCSSQYIYCMFSKGHLW